jgi:transcriptional regulator with XRE-family HTH domain
MAMQLTYTVDEGGAGRGYADTAMNRIREIREAAGLTQEQLAERVGTSGNHIWRLESGRSRLTQSWMTRLAEALACSPADLIANVVAAEVGSDVEIIDHSDPVVRAIATLGLRAYRVIQRSVINVGVAPGDIITVDESEGAVTSPKIGDVVLVEIGPDRNKVLRQFIPPSMLVTNRGGANLAIDLNDPSVNPEIVGLVIRDPKPTAS